MHGFILLLRMYDLMSNIECHLRNLTKRIENYKFFCTWREKTAMKIIVEIYLFLIRSSSSFVKTGVYGIPLYGYSTLH